MYFGINPFGLAFGYNQPQQHQNAFQQRPAQNNNGGFLNGLNNFIHNNFMNPFFQNNQPNQQERSPPPRPTFFRKNNNRPNEERNHSAKK